MRPTAAIQDYKRSIMARNGPLQLVILGKDAYPSDPTGIAFCKETWPGQANHSCSGRYVLEALGVDWQAERMRCQTPADLFRKLAAAGVVFFNACYAPPNGKRFSKATHRRALEEGYGFNREILEAAPLVVRCGEARLMDWVVTAGEAKYWDVVHPDVRNSFNRWTKERWATTWGRSGSLAHTWPNKPSNIHLDRGATDKVNQ